MVYQELVNELLRELDKETGYNITAISDLIKLNPHLVHTNTEPNFIRLHVTISHGNVVITQFPHVTDEIDLSNAHELSEILELLRTNGIKLNENEEAGNIAFHISSDHSADRIVESLTKNGIDIFTSDGYKYALASDSSAQCSSELDFYVRVGGTGVTPFGMAIALGLTEIADLSIRHGANINQKYPNGQTLIEFAISEGMVSMVRTLLDAGADIKTDSSKLVMSILRNKNCDPEVLIKLLTDAGMSLKVQIQSEDDSSISMRHSADWQMLIALQMDTFNTRALECFRDIQKKHDQEESEKNLEIVAHFEREYDKCLELANLARAYVTSCVANDPSLRGQADADLNSLDEQTKKAYSSWITTKKCATEQDADIAHKNTVLMQTVVSLYANKIDAATRAVDSIEMQLKYNQEEIIKYLGDEEIAARLAKERDIAFLEGRLHTAKEEFDNASARAEEAKAELKSLISTESKIKAELEEMCAKLAAITTEHNDCAKETASKEDKIEGASQMVEIEETERVKSGDTDYNDNNAASFVELSGEAPYQNDCAN